MTLNVRQPEIGIVQGKVCLLLILPDKKQKQEEIQFLSRKLRMAYNPFLHDNIRPKAIDSEYTNSQ